MASTTVAASGTAAASTAFAGGVGSGFYQLQVANTTSAWAYINLGVVGSLAAATVATGLPVGPGLTKTISVAPEVNGASVILASSTGNVIFTRGEGIGST